jgi:hypothetical protein
MDHIDKYLATAATDKKYLPSIQAALAIGKRLLNKYYSSTDRSKVYRIAMSKKNCSILPLQLILHASVLHPSHKLEYFAQAGWDKEWCATAEKILRTEFRRAYANIQVDDDNVPAVRFLFLLSVFFLVTVL